LRPHKLGLNDVFELTLSADEVANGKPAPDVYLEVCRRLDISPEKVIALEDSLTGVRSAVAAGITTIAVPEHNKKEFAIADYIVNEIENVIDITEEYFK
jgi:beta-phosphoglucomutase-like phosphatase (HAD superfamily)